MSFRRLSLTRRAYATIAVLGLLAIPAVASQAATVRGWLAQGRVAQNGSLYSTSITLDGSEPGTPFQGVGAISGGGGNSRLLIDYPAKQRQQILDYLFKPGYGASLQILKLEIGGDAYATDGAEPSIEHTRGNINCGAGYEFWLAQQARELNPNIALYGLQWNAPSWVGHGGQNAWTTSDIDYLIDWLHCATKNHLRINYIGGWNEHLPHGITTQVMDWFEELRSTLNADGYGRVQIVGVDSFAQTSTDTDVSDFLAKYPKFRSAIAVLGYHNLCRYPANGKVCFLPAAARTLGKPIWESEIGALREGTGVPAMARSLNNAYIQVGATGMIAWPLMGSQPANLPLEDRGLVTAEQPWSGQYQVNQLTWIIAQTTQFTRPGWVHLLGANHAFGGSYGSYVSYEAPDHSAWSVVAQTSDATLAQSITVHITGGLPDSTVHVWQTSINSASPDDWFVHDPDVTPSSGVFSYVLQPGYVYTFTTLREPGKGNPGTIPAAKPLALPYAAKPDASNEPEYLAPQDGAFEYLAGSTTTFEQTAVGEPVFWQNATASRFPYAVLGDTNWGNYTVSASVSFTATGQSAGLIARFDHPLADGVAQLFNGYQFVVSQSGAWRLFTNAAKGSSVTPSTLASGTLGTALDPGTFYPISLSAEGDQLTASINGTQVASVSDSTYAAGDAGVSTGGWYPVQFKDLQVTSLGTTVTGDG